MTCLDRYAAMCECNLVFIGSVCWSTRLHCFACLCCNFAVGAKFALSARLSSLFTILLSSPHSQSQASRLFDFKQFANDSFWSREINYIKFHINILDFLLLCCQTGKSLGFAWKTFRGRLLSRLEFCVFIENVLFCLDERGKFASAADLTEIGWRWGIMLN